MVLADSDKRGDVKEGVTVSRPPTLCRYKGATSDGEMVSDAQLDKQIPGGYHVLFDAAVYSGGPVLAPYRGVRYHLK